MRAWLALLLAVNLPVVAAEPSSAPLFSMTYSDLQSRSAKLDEFRGKPLIVNFWARWCAPCRVEIPELVDVESTYKGRELAVIGINIESDAMPVRDFAKAYDINYPVFLTGEKGMALMQALGNSRVGLPFTVVLNADGDIVKTKLGAMTRSDLEAAAKAALNAKGM